MEAILATGLGIYLSTTIISIILQKISVAYICNRLDKEGYYDKSRQLSILEKIKEELLTVLTLLTPFKNLYLTSIIYSNLDQTYIDVLEDGLEDGTIVRKNEKLSNLEEKINSNSLNNNIKTPNTNKELKEALEEEKKFLLSLNQKEETKSYNDHGSLKK